MNLPKGNSRALGVLLYLLTQTAAAADQKPPNYGHDLFHRQWSVNDPIGPATGDGLGPLFNAKSCVACHHQGTAGGGGELGSNVQLLSLTTMERSKLPRHLGINLQPFNPANFSIKLPHPEFARRTSVVLHRFSANDFRDPAGDVGRGAYAQMRARWMSFDPLTVLGTASHDFPFIPVRETDADRARHVVALVRSERNTPALFGSGLIDQVPTAVLARLAEQQNRRFPEISGRVAPGGGKFGWRGQTASLREFVLGACANELGLQTAAHRQAPDPSVDPGPVENLFGPHEQTIDMYEEQINALVAYIAKLEPPSQAIIEGGAAAQAWKRGQRYFNAARCNACHVERVHFAEGLYSDLLLHDLGPELNDPVAASPPNMIGGYFGSAFQIAATDEQKQEWRTPPLWGVRLSSPYLHDGRAATIEEAILLHGGEAGVSRQLYRCLQSTAQADLVAFVESLGAP